MTDQPVTARANWPLARVVVAMEAVGVNRVPVVDADGRPAGIFTRADVLRVLARRISDEMATASHGKQAVPA